MHTKHEKAKQLTAKEQFIYSRQKFNTAFSSCLGVIISKMYFLYILQYYFKKTRPSLHPVYNDDAKHQALENCVGEIENGKY